MREVFNVSFNYRKEKYTYDDYLKTSDDERYELMRGTCL